MYGRSNLFCSYLYRTTKHNTKLKIEMLHNNLHSDNTKMELLIFYSDTNIVDRIILDSTEKSLQYENVALVEIFFYIKHPMSTNPFEILLKETEKGGLQIWVYVVIVIVSILFPFTVIFLCFYIHFHFKKRRQSQANVPSQDSNREQAAKRTKIENLFNSTLKPLSFDINLHLKYDSKCTICLDELKTNELICITLCHHVFHYKCLSSWLYKTSASIRCPNCNQDISSSHHVTHFDEATLINVQSSENVIRTIQMTASSNE